MAPVVSRSLLHVFFPPLSIPPSAPLAVRPNFSACLTDFFPHHSFPAFICVCLSPKQYPQGDTIV